MTKASFFLTQKQFGGGILPIIAAQSTAAAYEDNGKIVVLPFSTATKEITGIYYSAPLTKPVNVHIAETFSANNVVESKCEIGTCIASVWRPGRTPYDDISLDGKHNENLRSDKQALLLLVTKLSEIFLTIEPTTASMGTFGHRLRELHLLACMEVENYFKDFLKEGLLSPPDRPSTNDYVKLAAPLYLSEYYVNLPQFPNIPKIFPFKNWDIGQPTLSLTWYDDYNKSKHNRRENFGCSSLKSTIDSVAAAVVLFTVRHGMHRLGETSDMLSLQVSQIMRIGIDNSDVRSWYVPKVKLNHQVTLEQSALVESVLQWVRISLSL